MLKQCEIHNALESFDLEYKDMQERVILLNDKCKVLEERKQGRSPAFGLSRYPNGLTNKLDSRTSHPCAPTRKFLGSNPGHEGLYLHIIPISLYLHNKPQA